MFMPGVLIMNNIEHLSTREKLIGAVLASPPLLLVLALVLGVIAD
jgi:hypothetical protein